MFTYQERGDWFAPCAAGLEDLLAQELAELGANEIHPAVRGVAFQGDHRILYTCLYGSRLASRMFAPLARFACPEEKVLYRVGKKIPWEQVFRKGQTFALQAHVSHSRIKHSRYALQVLKDAIVDRLREIWGERPSVDPKNPAVRINLRVQKNHATLSLDLGNGPLSHRGYRQESVEAPLAENLAAAMLRLSAWDGSRPLWDPMCGSGTLLCESLMVASNIPAGHLRKSWGVMSLPDFDGKLWSKVREKMDRDIKPLARGLLQGSDLDPLAVEAARKNLSALPGCRAVALRHKDFREMPDFENGVVLCNPPYGIRLEDKDSAGELVGELASFMKHRCGGSTGLLFLGDKDLLKRVGLKPDWKKPVKAGGLDARIAQYTFWNRATKK